MEATESPDGRHRSDAFGRLAAMGNTSTDTAVVDTSRTGTADTTLPSLPTIAASASVDTARTRLLAKTAGIGGTTGTGNTATNISRTNMAAAAGTARRISRTMGISAITGLAPTRLPNMTTDTVGIIATDTSAKGSIIATDTPRVDMTDRTTVIARLISPAKIVAVTAAPMGITIFRVGGATATARTTVATQALAATSEIDAQAGIRWLAARLVAHALEWRALRVMIAGVHRILAIACRSDA